MAEYDIIPCYDEEELFSDRKNNPTDLHAYYMTQFNLELENSKKKNDNFKFGVEESFDFEVLDNWNETESARTDFEIIDEVIDNNINEQNIKEVLLDLDNIDFEEKCYKTNSTTSGKDQTNGLYETNHDYIDDESLIDELCREDESRLTPEGFKDEYLNTNMTEKNLLPSIDTVFNKRYHYNYEETHKQNFTDVNNTTLNTNQTNNIEHYSYPNNILHNLDSRYILPDTPTSCTEFSFDRNERKISICESIESDVQSSTYYDENSETFDEDELFVNLDDFGIHIEGETETNAESPVKNTRKLEKDKSQGTVSNTYINLIFFYDFIVLIDVYLQVNDSASGNSVTKNI